eukprot:PhM_4_TR2060/c0_g1_i9/m.99938
MSGSRVSSSFRSVKSPLSESASFGIVSVDISDDIGPVAAPQIPTKLRSTKAVPLASPSQHVTTLRRRITLGLLHAPFFATNSDVDSCVAASNFVDKLYRHAERSVAVVHQCFGNHIVVSWNTARHATQHE